MSVLEWLFNCLRLLFVGLFFLAFLRGLGKWGVLLFAFSCALFGGVSMAEWTGNGAFTPLVFLLAVVGILALWVGDKLIAGALWLADRCVSLFGWLLAKVRGVR